MLNQLVGGGFLIMLGYIVYKSIQSPTPSPERFGLLVAQDTGKTKYVQSRTDASLHIERIRRRAIQKNPHQIHESRTQFGSTTGAVEAFRMSKQ